MRVKTTLLTHVIFKHAYHSKLNTSLSTHPGGSRTARSGDELDLHSAVQQRQSHTIESLKHKENCGFYTTSQEYRNAKSPAYNYLRPIKELSVVVTTWKDRLSLRNILRRQIDGLSECLYLFDHSRSIWPLSRD